MVGVAVIPRTGVARMSSWKVPDLVSEHVLLHVPSGGETSITNVASEWTLLCVAPVVDVQCALAGEGFKAYVAGGAHLAGAAKWWLRRNTMTQNLEVQETHVHALDHLFSAFFFLSGHSSIREPRRVSTASWGRCSTVNGTILHTARRTASIFWCLGRVTAIGHAWRDVVLMATDDVGHLLQWFARVVVAQRTSCINSFYSVFKSLKRRRVRR